MGYESNMNGCSNKSVVRLSSCEIASQTEKLKEPALVSNMVYGSGSRKFVYVQRVKPSNNNEFFNFEDYCEAAGEQSHLHDQMIQPHVINLLANSKITMCRKWKLKYRSMREQHFCRQKHLFRNMSFRCPWGEISLVLILTTETNIFKCEGNPELES
ncbi:hypothetical protein C5167_042540 [Papaver somniferum]|uniref:Uncharacterized protein n=1 Tax=Papaver somniferum TaxID=3469 RepID=A0A4Y7L4U6_PAPSO|nr:hypothetical protein C5167_042540 [Papaver somniferum]